MGLELRPHLTAISNLVTWLVEYIFILTVFMVFERLSPVYDNDFLLLESDNDIEAKRRNIAITVVISVFSAVIIVALISCFVIWTRRTNMGKTSNIIYSGSD